MRYSYTYTQRAKWTFKKKKNQFLPRCHLSSTCISRDIKSIFFSTELLYCFNMDTFLIKRPSTSINCEGVSESKKCKLSETTTD